MPCSVNGCTRGAAKAGMCEMHYMRKWRHGSTERRRRSCSTGIFNSDGCIIHLTKGYEAIVDAADFERLLKFTWAVNLATKPRALRMEGRAALYLHHAVLQVNPSDLSSNGLEVDHIDGNPLNNRKSNLRIVSHIENMRNTNRHKNRVGYCFNKRSNSWIVYLDSPDKIRKYLGYRKTEEEAIKLIEEAR